MTGFAPVNGMQPRQPRTRRAAPAGGRARTSPAPVSTPTSAAPKLKPVAPYAAFPVESLPSPICDFIGASASAIGCDTSFVALPMLSVLAAAIGNSRRIELKPGWSEPSIVWTSIVGESGTQKTPALWSVLDPVQDHERRLQREHEAELAEHDAAMARYTIDRRNWNGKGEAPTEPRPPAERRVLMSDTTIEAAARILSENPRGVLLARDELSGWLKGFDQYKSRGGGEAAHWLSIHAGKSLIVDRKTGEPRRLCVPMASVSITGSIQPETLDSALGLEHRHNGLAARLLFARPPRQTKRWSEAEVHRDTRDAYGEVLRRLFSLRMDSDDSGDPVPALVKLSDAGKVAWIEFYNEHAAEQANLTGDLAAAWSKLEAYAARFALIVHWVRWAADDPALVRADQIDHHSVAAGVVLARWFGHEARRLYSTLGETEEDRTRRRLADLVESKGGSISVRDLQRSGRQYHTADDAEAALQGLVSAGLGEWTYGQIGEQGGHPSKRFRLARADTTTGGEPESRDSVGVGAVGRGAA